MTNITGDQIIPAETLWAALEPQDEQTAAAREQRLSAIRDLLATVEREGLRVDEHTWRPDHWTGAWLQGLLRVQDELKDHYVVEVGFGSGLVTAGLVRLGVREIQATDISPYVLDIAQQNLKHLLGPDQTASVHLTQGSLLDGVEQDEAKSWDRVVACIPQAKLPPGEDLYREDNTGNYYSHDEVAALNGHVAAWDRWGLGLNAALLIEAYQFLPDGGEIVLNLGGRPGQDTLLRLFRETGFKPNVVYQRIVHQDPGTDLSPFAADEQDGIAFEFFRDPAGREPINAEEAYQLQQEHLRVYHAIYVIRGKK